MRPNHRRSGLICNIDVTAFASVMLVFVWMFMGPVVTEVDRHRGASVDLPLVGDPISMRAADREDAMVVGITRDGKVFFRTDPVTVEWLPGRIREGVSQGAERKVYIKADRRAKYGWVAEVLDSVRSAGIEKIGLIVVQRRTPIPDQ
jgi:biopolymer transport protein TolR